MDRPPAPFERPDVPDEALDPGELGRRNFLRAAGVFGASVSLGVSSMAPADASSANSQSAVVRGYVFDDRRGTGRRHPQAPGIPGVAVSDGEAIAVTDARGYYALTINPTRRTTGIVFVTVPPGWSAPPDADMIPGFFRHVAVEPGREIGVDFGLRRDPRGADVNYRFLAAADPHVRLSGGFPFDPDPLARWRGQIRQFNDIVSGERDDDTAPRFLTVAGDVTQIGVPDEFDAFRAGTRDSIVPVWPVLGNHDYPLAGLGVPQNPNYDSIVDGYRKAIGPEWYSFSYGNQHFVVLDNMIGVGQPDQLKWLEDDLALHADRDVVLMFHAPFAEKDWWLARYFPDHGDSIAQAYLDVLEPYSVQLMLSGHAHVNRVDRVSRPGTLHVNTNSSYYSLDNSPLGFRLLTVHEDREVRAPFRVYGVPFVVTLVHPAAGSQVPEGTTTAQVSTYNTTSQIASVRFRVDDGPWRRMNPTGDWTWSAPLDVTAIGRGRHRWQVEVRDAANRRKTSAAAFDVVADEFPEPRPGADWPMFHGAPARGGLGVDSVAPPLRLAWSYRSEGTILCGSPAIAADSVYIGIRDENDVTSCALAAIDLASGDERWRVTADSLVEASPAVVDGKVFTTSVAGTLQALDAASGDLVWDHRADGGDPLTYPKAYSSPAVAEGVVVNLHQITGGPSVLAARDVETGHERWSYTADSFSVATSSKPVAINDGRVYFTAGNTFITQPPRAVDLATGQLVWTGRARSATGDDAVLAGQGPVVCADNALVVNYVDRESQGPNAVLAFDVTSDDDPNELWRYIGPRRVLAEANLHGTAPAVDARTVYATLPSGFVVALDLATGAERWRRDLGAALLSSPALSGDTLYVGANDGRLSALSISSGEVVWSFKASSTWVASSPAVSGNTVVVGAWDGNVYAFTAT